MLSKKFYKSKCKVSFELHPEEQPDDIEIEKISVVGDFNDWDTEATPLRKLKSKVWKEFVDLELDSEYSYRYFINGEIWYNDPAADDYIPNNVDGENCIVVTYQSDEE